MTAPTRPDSSRKSWHRRATKPVTYWLIALIVLGVVHRWIPSARWVLVHALTLGLLTNSILVWGQHFTETLLHARLDESIRRVQVIRIYMLNVGILVLTAGMIGVWRALIVLGATIVGGAVTWYAVDLVRQLRAALPSRFRPIVRNYVVAAAFLPLGAILGAWMGVQHSEVWLPRLLLAHVAVNLLGFVGITIFTTLVTFWPTVLRTPMLPGQERVAVTAIATMAGSALVVAGAALADLHVLAAAGLCAYLAAVLVQYVYLAGCARSAPPREFAPLSIGFGLVWLLVALGWAIWIVGSGRTGELGTVSPVLLGGFAAQVLFGAMSFLMPTVMRGGPSAVRAGMIRMNRMAAFRLVLINAGLLVYLAPGGTSWTRVIGSACAFAGYVLFVPCMIRAVRAQLAVIKNNVAARAAGPDSGESAPRQLGMPSVGAPRATAGAAGAAGADTSVHPAGPAGTVDRNSSVEHRAARPEIAPNGKRHLKGALVGLVVVALSTTAVLVADPASPLRGRQTEQVTPTGVTTTVEVTAKDMRFTPASVDVPVGNRLVIVLRNTDTTVHDLHLVNGTNSGRVEAGATTTVDAGVIGRGLDGWCTIAGHKAMGMVFHVNATGAVGPGGMNGHAMPGTAGGTGARSGSAPAIDFMAPPSKDYPVRDARLAPARPGREHALTLTVEEKNDELAPGMRRPVWTYNGRVDGPELRGRVGETFVVTLVNKGSMGHSIDFHAGDVRPDEVMRTIAPGESLTYRFTVTRSGAWLYHCATMPMTGHLSAGMFGAVIVDPPGLPAVGREFLLVQSEYYVGAENEAFDMDKIRENTPDIVMFNGHATQYNRYPLQAKAGEKIRIWVVAAGPNDGTSFHVVGAQFDTVYKEGAYLLREGRGAFGPDATGGSQSLDLGPAQGGFVEMTILEPGRYTFVDHSFVDAERGAHGYLDVT